MPSTSSATTSTSIWAQVITSMKNAGRQPEVSTSFTLIATRSMPRPACRPAAAPSSTFVPTPSQPAAISGSPTDGVYRPAKPPWPPSTWRPCVEVTAARMRSTTASEASRLTPEPAYVSGGRSLAHRISTGTGAASKRSFARRMSAGISVGYTPGQAGAAEALGRPVVASRPSSER